MTDLDKFCHQMPRLSEGAMCQGKATAFGLELFVTRGTRSHPKRPWAPIKQSPCPPPAGARGTRVGRQELFSLPGSNPDCAARTG